MGLHEPQGCRKLYRNIEKGWLESMAFTCGTVRGVRNEEGPSQKAWEGVKCYKAEQERGEGRHWVLRSS